LRKAVGAHTLGAEMSAVVQLDRRLPSGWTVGMHLVPLGDGGLLVYSPTWLGEKTWERVEAHGRPRFLVAPNHFHHLSLSRYRQRYPEAVAVASPQAIPRLVKQGHRDLTPADELGAGLPEGFKLLRPEGLKTGELFLSLPGTDGRTWVVCDAFFNVAGPLVGLKGLPFRLLRTGPGLAVGTTFWWLALRSLEGYLGWLEAALAEDRPRRVLFSHGQPLEGDDVPERLLTLARRRLR
jgi:hypothetical protein